MHHLRSCRGEIALSLLSGLSPLQLACRLVLAGVDCIPVEQEVNQATMHNTCLIELAQTCCDYVKVVTLQCEIQAEAARHC